MKRNNQEPKPIKIPKEAKELAQSFEKRAAQAVLLGEFDLNHFRSSVNEHLIELNKRLENL